MIVFTLLFPFSHSGFFRGGYIWEKSFAAMQPPEERKLFLPSKKIVRRIWESFSRNSG
jgi:hypothetical protein